MASTLTKPRQLTRDDYDQSPIGGPRYQLIEGELQMSPSPNRYHQTVTRNLAYIVINYLNTHPIGVAYTAPFDVYLSDINVFQPDILYVSNDRKKHLTPKGMEGAPDFVAEVLSPGTDRFDCGPKRQVYIRNGVNELWILNPEKREIQIYRPNEDPQKPVSTVGAIDQVESPLFPGLTIHISEIFKDDV